MNKPRMPVSADLIVTQKGSAVPLSLTPKPASVSQPIANEGETNAAPYDPIVSHNFRVRKSLKKAFDRAAFDLDMTNVKFLEHVFAFYQKHHPPR